MFFDSKLIETIKGGGGGGGGGVDVSPQGLIILSPPRLDYSKSP